VPFTLAHGAAALPFRRSRLVLSAVLVGTFAPDFEYFLRLAPEGRVGHTLAGALFLTLPAALLMLWIFHAVVKVPTARLLPEGVERRLAIQLGAFRFGGGGRFSLIIGSLLVGIATHILWDSFTHAESWFPKHCAFLQHPLPLPLLGTEPLFRVLQHFSTIAGLAILAAWLARWYRRSQPSTEVSGIGFSPRGKRLMVTALGSVALLAGLGRAFCVTGIPMGPNAYKRFLAYAVVTAVALLWWELVLYGTLSAVRSWAARPDQARSRTLS
jgi:hypothetical protein